MNRVFLMLTILSYPLIGSSSQEADAKQKGLDIALKVRKAGEGFKGERSEMKMILIDAYGARTEREMLGKTQEVEGEGDKSLMIFQSPRDVFGTKMLTWSKREGSDDQWLYLPSLRRVRRISSNNRMASFMGSEFSFEDLGSQEVERYNFKFLRDDVYNDEDVYVVQRVPKDSSGYSKMILYISKERLNALKIEYFDRREELLKIARMDDFKEYEIEGRDEKIWRSNRIHMKNVQNEKESIFEWNNRELGLEHPDRIFSQSALSD